MTSRPALMNATRCDLRSQIVSAAMTPTRSASTTDDGPTASAPTSTGTATCVR